MKSSFGNFSDPNFRVLFEAAPNPYLILSPDLNIVAVNDAYLNATLTKRNEILGQAVFDIFPDNPADTTASGVGNLRSSLLRVLESKKADAMAVQKYDIPRPGGGFEEKHWSPLNTPVLNEAGKVEYIIHRVEDVTEFIHLKQKGAQHRKLAEELQNRTEQMESEIFQRAQQVQEANKKLREAERLKGDFFANVSHELRTPLTLILGPIESLLSAPEALDESQASHLKTVHNNAVRLLQLVNGLLDFSKVEAGKMTVRREPTDIVRLVNSVLNDFESMLQGKNVTLTSRITPVGKNVMIDRYLFERILFNLLSNAAKFTPEGGAVSVTMEVNDDKVRLHVIDTGIGIPASQLPKLFQKFHQLEGSSTRRFEGTGLGLAMIKEFAELLDGGVSVESIEGKGSTFSVVCYSPLTDNEQTTDDWLQSTTRSPVSTGSLSAVHTNGSASSDAFLKVLICEDNEELSQYIESLLQGWCYIRKAHDGEEALELVRSWSPDLVLTDLMMPKKDGIEVCTAIKNNPATANTIVILLTAVTHRNALMRGWEAKADEYIFKPFHPQELVTRVKSFFTIISERKRIAAIIDEKNRELEYSNKELEAFSYSVSHDLRAPLRSIDGYTKILQEDHRKELNEDGKNVLNAILRNTKKMGNLIDDLLEFSHLNKKELTKSSIDMDRLVKDLINDHFQNTNSQRIDFRIQPLHGGPGDLKMIKQVWVNLLSNAIKYSSQQEQSVVEIASSVENEFITYSIKDNGVGFDMKYYDKLFGVFQRLHAPTEFEGTGVGLAIVNRIIAKHDGRVWAKGHVHKGATFYFSIPK